MGVTLHTQTSGRCAYKVVRCGRVDDDKRAGAVCSHGTCGVLLEVRRRLPHSECVEIMRQISSVNHQKYDYKPKTQQWIELEI